MTDRHSSCLRPLSLSQHMAARVAALRCHARASRSPASLRASMSSSSVPPRKLRVLALHSFRTSGEILKAQMEIAGWHKQDVLGDMCEFVCAPDGLPATGPIPEDVAMFFPEPTYAYHEWWNATKVEGSMEYVGLEESLERVRAAWEDSGPFDGVMGFSQGATMTTLLAAKGVVEGWGPFAASSGRRAIPFAICVSGALPRTEATRGLSRARAQRTRPSPLCTSSAKRTGSCHRRSPSARRSAGPSARRRLCGTKGDTSFLGFRGGARRDSCVPRRDASRRGFGRAVSAVTLCRVPTDM